ncbi:hypothetical protein PDE_06299 [Penicillium oxalicum 114-2]|uniref:Uncharacterized protein n=1 Tax=Penicillium oxalicum (strain 114-2 / CGMCC 5302) TaxID=933388 RepID=S7ZM17_PENO1|nr:hypothetical protein PDE_06299 [Penicillium oxalicum 114-2]
MSQQYHADTKGTDIVEWFPERVQNKTCNIGTCDLLDRCGHVSHGSSASVAGTITNELLLVVMGCEAGVISRPWMQWAGLQEPQICLGTQTEGEGISLN